MFNIKEKLTSVKEGHFLMLATRRNHWFQLESKRSLSLLLYGAAFYWLFCARFVFLTNVIAWDSKYIASKKIFAKKQVLIHLTDQNCHRVEANLIMPISEHDSSWATNICKLMNKQTKNSKLHTIQIENTLLKLFQKKMRKTSIIRLQIFILVELWSLWLMPLSSVLLSFPGGKGQIPDFCWSKWKLDIWLDLLQNINRFLGLRKLWTYSTRKFPQIYCVTY